MDIQTILIIIGAGLLCGFINTLAGSGSLITLPVLIFFGGLPANVANGTNRIAILLQNVVAVGSFKQQKVLDSRKGLFLSIPVIAGSIVGAQLAVDLNEEVMERAIGIVFVFMFFVILFKPDRWIRGQGDLVREKPNVLQIVVMFFIGVYGGFIQAGTGILLLAGLVLSSGFDLVRANAIKLLIVLVYTPFALAVFFYNDQVNITLGLTLAVGNMIGAFIASRFAVSWGPQFVRYVLIAVVVFSAAKFLGLFDMLT